MTSRTYRLRSKLQVYPGMAAWRFLILDVGHSAAIRRAHGAGRPGFGSIPVEATIGKTSWLTSIFPTKDGPYVLPLKAAVRRKEDIDDDDTVSFVIRIR